MGPERAIDGRHARAVERLAGNIQWTTDLGNAFLAQQQDVLAAIQRMRAKAQGKGALKTSQEQTVKTETVEGGKEVIVIQQPNPEVVYVPSYDPMVVYGPPAYPYYPYTYPGYGAGDRIRYRDRHHPRAAGRTTTGEIAIGAAGTSRSTTITISTATTSATAPT